MAIQRLYKTARAPSNKVTNLLVPGKLRTELGHVDYLPMVAVMIWVFFVSLIEKIDKKFY
jgi:hypothetical protein